MTKAAAMYVLSGVNAYLPAVQHECEVVENEVIEMENVLVFVAELGMAKAAVNSACSSLGDAVEGVASENISNTHHGLELAAAPAHVEPGIPDHALSFIFLSELTPQLSLPVEDLAVPVDSVASPLVVSDKDKGKCQDISNVKLTP